MRISIPPFHIGEPLVVNIVNDPLQDMLEIDTAVSNYIDRFKTTLLTKLHNTIRSTRNG